MTQLNPQMMLIQPMTTPLLMMQLNPLMTQMTQLAIQLMIILLLTTQLNP